MTPELEHRDGRTWWNRAPIPRRLHRCTVWTRGHGLERCACGAIREVGTRWWFERNSRRERRL